MSSNKNNKKNNKNKNNNEKYATSALFIEPDPKDLPIPRFKKDGSMFFVQKTKSTNG